MGISIEDLLNLRFFYRKLEHRMLIVLEGQPRPVIRTSTVSRDIQGAVQIENFNPKIYDQVYWLTGSEASQSFYCWSCLLFREGDNQWNEKFVKQALLLDLITCHGETSYHAEADLKFRTYLKSFNSKYLSKVKMNSSHNFYELFCTNQEILKLLIEVVCSVVTEDKPYRRRNSSHTEISQSSCMEAIRMLKCRHNTRLKYCYDAITLLQMHPTLINDLVDSITMVIRSAIKTEVQKSTYASLIFGGHHTNSTNSQLSVVLRYIRKGKVQERFLGFLNIPGCKSVNVIYDIIRRTIEEFHISEKFLSYSFDGSVLELSELSDLNDLLQKEYPQSYFVPCYFQGILYTFQKSLTMQQDVTQFFEILCDMEDFFKEAAERYKILEKLIVLNLTNENKHLYVEAPFIEIVRLCWKHLVEVFKSMANSCNEWSAYDYNKIGNFIEFLEDFKMVFFLHILPPLFEHIVQLDKDLRMFSPEKEFRSVIIPRIMSGFRYEKYNFPKYFSNAIQEMNIPNNDEFTATCLSEYITVIDHLEKEITLRFSNLDSLFFCSLINSNLVNISQLASIHFYSKLENVPKLNFTSQQLHGEIKKMQLKYKIFENKNAYVLLHFLECANYDFPCTKKLLEFSLTIPFKPPAQDEDLSMFQKLKNLSYSSCTVDSGDASVLHAESNFLLELQSDIFNCCALVNFYKMNKCDEF